MNGNSDFCFTCHNQTQLTGTGSNFWSNGSGFGNNLHGLHLAGITVDQRIGARCPDCHYNIHSNSLPNNTEYWGTNSGTVSPVSLFPPARQVSALVNFAPHVKVIPDAPRETKPSMTYLWRDSISKVNRRCILQCHVGNSGNPTSMDYWYGGDLGTSIDPTYTANPPYQRIQLPGGTLRNFDLG